MEGAAHLILVELAGNARVRGWDGPDLLVRTEADPDNSLLAVEKSPEGLAVSVADNCELKVPAGLPLYVRQAQGNLSVEEVASLNAEQVRGNLRLDEVAQVHLAEVYGNLKVEEVADLRVVGTVYGNVSLKEVQVADLQNVRGDLAAKELGQLRASRVGGNLVAKEIAGRLEADRIGGNATLKTVGGTVAIDQVAGNLTARGLAGGAQVPRIGGNLLLNGGLGRGQSYHFQADGNALLRLTAEDGAHITLSARGKILSSLPLAEEERGEGRLSGTLGEGGAEIAVEARGNIVLGSEGSGVRIHVEVGDDVAREWEESLRGVNFEAIGQQVTQEMEAAMSRLRVKLETTDWQRFGSQAQQAVERAMQGLQRNMDRAAAKAARYEERAQRARERAARAAERQAGQNRAAAGEEDWQEGEPDSPTEAAPVASVDEERLSILRMVEQGQITPQEAELLLDALG
jgi:hypothetical protein